MTNTFRAVCAAAWLWCISPLAVAGPGHDHGDEAPAQSGAAAPRFTASSEAFELVGIANRQHLTLYLDRYADNSPVKEARIELEIAGEKLTAKPHGDGEFEAELAKPLQHGVIPVTAMVTVGNESDLLAGQIEIAEARHEEAAKRHWQDYIGWAAAVLTALLLAGWAVRRALARRSSNAEGIA